VQTLLTLSSCSGLEESEQEKIREQNAKGEYLYRRHDDVIYRVTPPRHRDRDPYPWEED